MGGRTGFVPRHQEDWHLVVRTARLVLSVPAYGALALVSSLVGLSTFVLTQNVPLVQAVVIGGSLPLENRLTVLVELYPLVGTAFTPLTEALLLSTAVLFGVNAAMLAYHLRENRVELREGGGSVAGVVFGTLGAGCAACGSAILAGLFSLFGVTGLLTQLPLDGLEFSLLALVALVFSLYWLADGMRGGTVAGCPIDVGG